MFTILIGTCDKYSFLWSDFVHLFNKYWDHSIQCEKIFLSQTISPEYEGFKSFLPGDVPYSECLLYALNRIDTDYVLWLQDDYFFRRTISQNTFNSYIKFIKNHNINRFGICEDSYLYTKLHITDSIFRLHQHSLYTISMQASIWNKEFFKSCILIPETPWQFEIDGSYRLNKQKQHNICFDAQNPPWYLEAMRKGEFTSDYKIIKQQESMI